MHINFKTIKWKNFLSTGNTWTTIDLTKNKTTLIIGSNGNGKCLRSSTTVDVSFVNENTEKKFIEFIKAKKHYLDH